MWCDTEAFHRWCPAKVIINSVRQSRPGFLKKLDDTINFHLIEDMVGQWRQWSQEAELVDCTIVHVLHGLIMCYLFLPQITILMVSCVDMEREEKYIKSWIVCMLSYICMGQQKIESPHLCYHWTSVNLIWRTTTAALSPFTNIKRLKAIGISSE